MITQLGAGYALVPVPPVPDWATWEGGGPISKSSQASLPAHAGNYVYRSPLNVVREAEPGANWPQNLQATKMFLPDGRLVDAKPYAYDQFRGVDVLQPVVSQTSRLLSPPFVAMCIGAAAGYQIGRSNRVMSAIGGAIIGGVLGRVFG
jgi:hypothetical protein